MIFPVARDRTSIEERMEVLSIAARMRALQEVELPQLRQRMFITDDRTGKVTLNTRIHAEYLALVAEWLSLAKEKNTGELEDPF